MKILIRYILIIILIQNIFCINAFAQNNNQTQNNQIFSNKAINYLTSIGLSPNDTNNKNKINLISGIIKSTEIKTPATDKDVANILLQLIQNQRFKARFGINTDKNFISKFPDKKTIKTFDKKFKSSNITIFDLNTNTNCIAENHQLLEKTFSKIPSAIKPIAVEIPEKGSVNKLQLTNMFGEIVGTITTTQPDAEALKTIKYKLELSQEYKQYTNDTTNNIIDIKKGSCEPNIIKVWQKQFSECLVCGFMTELNEIFFSLADSIYSFIANRLLILLSFFLGLWFIYQLGSSYINMGTDGQIDYKSFLINDTIKQKFVPVIIFISVLMIPPSIFVKWTIEPIVLIGVTVSKEIIKAGEISNINIKYSERKPISNMKITNEKVLENNKIILPKTEELLTTTGPESTTNPNHHRLNLDLKEQSKQNIKSYSSNILYAIYDVKEIISKHIIIGKILSEYAIKELIFKKENLLIPVAIGGAVATGPIIPIVAITTIITSKDILTKGALKKISEPIFNNLKEKVSYINILFIGGFIFISLILLNYILIFYFIEIAVNLGLLIIQIPFLCIAYIFGKANISSITDPAKDVAINFISISLITVFILMFIEYSYYNILDISPEMIKDTLEIGNTNILTSHLKGIKIYFFDIILIILTIFYVSKYMKEFISSISSKGNIGDTGFGKQVTGYVKTMIQKIVNTTRKIP